MASINVSQTSDDPGLRLIKRKLVECASDPQTSGWRTGYEQGLKSVLLEAYGIDAIFVPATYKFNDENVKS